MSEVGQPPKPETFTEGSSSKPAVPSMEKPSQPEALSEEKPSQPEALTEEKSLQAETSSEEQVAKPETSSEEPSKPLTFREVFPALESDPVAEMPITVQDAAAMQSAESLVFGATLKGGPSSKMQSAAAKNLQEGHTDRDSPTAFAGPPTEPVTYGELFPALESESVAKEAITLEDAKLMQTAEAKAFGKVEKGGPASIMQSAAARNVQDGLVEQEAHSTIAEEGVSVTQTAVPGAVLDVVYVAGVPVASSSRPTPTDPLLAPVDLETIGEALKAAAIASDDRPRTEDDDTVNQIEIDGKRDTP